MKKRKRSKVRAASARRRPRLSERAKSARRRPRLLEKAPTANRPGFVIDMDGVLYRGNELIPGAARFVERLKGGGYPFIFLTNNAEKSPRELQKKLSRLGVRVGDDCFFTAAMATARFLYNQKPKAKAYVIGGPGLTSALKAIGCTLTDRRPDYVVLGNATNYSYARVEKAINLVRRGARLVGTNPDLTGPVEGGGIIPGCGALIKPIELATGQKPYFIGKPNPLMMRMALRALNVRSSNAYMVGDRMDTDIQAGLETGMTTILVLSGVTSRTEMRSYAYRPHYLYNNVGQIPL